MSKYNLISFFFISFLSFSQIKVLEQKSENVSIIGKISHTSAFQKAGLSRKLPVLDPLRVSKNQNLNKFKELRRETNDIFRSVGLRKMSLIDEEFSASILYFKDLDKYLLTIKNSEYNYQNESIWMSLQTKEEIYNLVISEFEKKPKFKNIEVVLDNEVVLVISINRKKISLNLWDGYIWVKSNWYRAFKFQNLFGK
jgi:hypothetical protein